MTESFQQNNHEALGKTSEIRTSAKSKRRPKTQRTHFATTYEILTCCMLFLSITLGCAYPTTTVILVRHAEKGVGTDPPLTPAGDQRAQELVHVVEQAHIQAIYTTQYLRTKQTAQPLANHLNLTTIVVPVTQNIEQHARDVVANILEHDKGKSVLVVGHSNTVPRIIEELSIVSPPQITESEFNRLFVVLKKRHSSSKLIEATYGR